MLQGRTLRVYLREAAVPPELSGREKKLPENHREMVPFAENVRIGTGVHLFSGSAN